MRKTRDLFKKIRQDGHNKVQKQYGPNSKSREVRFKLLPGKFYLCTNIDTNFS